MGTRPRRPRGQRVRLGDRGPPCCRAAVRVGISQAFAEEGGLAFATPALEDVEPGIVAAIADSPYVTCFPESFDPAPFRVLRYRDPAADVPPKPLPDWWPGDDRPLVYMTFGSVAAAFPAAAGAYGKALEALGDLPVRVLLTVGRELELAEVPANVHVEQWVPQADVLAHAALVLYHGGSGTTLGAPAAGRPWSSSRSSPTSPSMRPAPGSSAPEWSRPWTRSAAPSLGCWRTAPMRRPRSGLPRRCVRCRRSTASSTT